jgi:5-methylcytosine-specific restriction endonuclease McrA
MPHRDPDKDREYKKAWAERNREKVLASKRAYEERNREKLLISRRARARTERVRAMAAARYEKNKNDPEFKQKRKAYAWHKLYPAKALANCRRRQIAKQNRTPAWVDDAERHEITGMYEAACLLGEMHCSPMHVDHKIPLRGKTVSGLHVLRNLQIIPAVENRRKGNKFCDEQAFSEEQRT